MTSMDNKPEKKKHGGFVTVGLVILALAVAEAGIAVFHTDIQDILQ